MSTIGKFLQWLHPTKREALSDILVDLQKTHGRNKWRIREIIANQMSLFVDIFSDEVVFMKLVPISIALCDDQVATAGVAGAAGGLCDLVRLLAPSGECATANYCILAASSAPHGLLLRQSSSAARRNCQDGCHLSR